jgi:hypothetical protein
MTDTAEQARAEFARFQRIASGRAQIEGIVPRRRMTVRTFYTHTTALAQANPWAPPLKWFGQYAGGRPPAVPRSKVHGGVTA